MKVNEQDWSEIAGTCHVIAHYEDEDLERKQWEDETDLIHKRAKLGIFCIVLRYITMTVLLLELKLKGGEI